MPVPLMVVALLGMPAQAWGLSCGPSDVRYVAACSSSGCDAGFVVESTWSGRGCHTIPRVRDSEPGEIRRAFELAWDALEPTRRAGILQFTVTPRCEEAFAEKARTEVFEYCLESSGYEVLAPEPGDPEAALAAARERWERRAAKVARNDLVKRIVEDVAACLLIVVPLAALLWMRRRRTSPLWLLLAVLVQAAAVPLVFLYTYFAHSETRLLGLLASLTLIIATLVELLLIAAHILRPRPDPGAESPLD